MGVHAPWRLTKMLLPAQLQRVNARLIYEPATRAPCEDDHKEIP